MNIKKLLAIAGLVLMPVTLQGCTSNSITPTETVKEFLDGYHDRDNTKIAANSTWKDYDATALELRDEDYMEDVDQQLQKKVYDMMLDFSHKEEKETIDEDKASVEVTLTMYDFSAVMDKGMKEAAKKADELSKKSDVDDKEIQKQILTVLFDNMAKASKDKTIHVTVDLVKEHGDWKVSDNNTALTDALLQNTQSIQNIAK
ncbi:MULTISPECIES: HAMP domain-containing histidine kinase [Bacillota]|uniref:HAMP domain-containing histidine kinase n=2 Tax=Amedibacillus TaxID=2749846 RepID=A0A7G9GL65_9FIRM|nr:MULTISPECIES: HAMP domain-containing histidine kinase [Bacillota]QNM11547.1 HAMP domain-containing histidine kinase [[Eubacterium] hominis]MCH4285210.1 HAMP domain-containing histidine kinase [Amedibacillus hominis]RGB56233.1 sensor histidine kinase [Absiella sp. AM22-9]RGB61996.1 sensor histidine kinase [Absiella sp. AM10-20]RGB70182.1 sensor histidine kinase [Absiella sp. AM09-45]